MLLNACKDIGLAANTGKTVGHHWGMMANKHNMVDSNSYEFKYLGSLLTNKNSIHGEINCRLKAANSCYYSVQTFLYPWLLLKNFKIKTYKTIILPVVLQAYETLREECRLRIFKNRILRRICGPKRHENGEWRRFHNEELHHLKHSSNIVRVIKPRSLRWAGYR